ncbi:hypothetical protein ACRAWD_25255 [Caulobacter segnis]
MAEVQKAGGTAAFVDAEHALGPGPTPASWASISITCWSPSPTTASRLWRSPTPWCAPGAVDIVVIDSVAAADPAGRNRRRDGRQPAGPRRPV